MGWTVATDQGMCIARRTGPGLSHWSRHGGAWFGEAWLGKARQGGLGAARRGRARPGGARWGSAVTGRTKRLTSLGVGRFALQSKSR